MIRSKAKGKTVNMKSKHPPCFMQKCNAISANGSLDSNKIKFGEREGSLSIEQHRCNTSIFYSDIFEGAMYRLYFFNGSQLANMKEYSRHFPVVIYRVEAVGRKTSNNTLKITIFELFMNFKCV